MYMYINILIHSSVYGCTLIHYYIYLFIHCMFVVAAFVSYFFLVLFCFLWQVIFGKAEMFSPLLLFFLLFSLRKCFSPLVFSLKKYLATRAGKISHWLPPTPFWSNLMMYKTQMKSIYCTWILWPNKLLLLIWGTITYRHFPESLFS